MARSRIDPAGIPFIAGALVVGVALGAALSWWLALPFAVVAGFCVFFFRDPHRDVTSGDHVVLSPADGRVLIAGDAVREAAPPGEWRQVSIFLSPMNVHVNRVPVSGRIARVSYTPGRFLPAYRHDAGTTNERSEIWIEHGSQTIVARQIVGALARRVVCRVQTGAVVHAGDRYGIMKFGSRMDVFLPTDAEIRVKVGEPVRGGQTVIAVLH